MFDLKHKIIVNSKHLRQLLRNAGSLTISYDGKGRITMGDIEQCRVECKTEQPFEFHISLERANRLGALLDQLKEQPLAITVERGIGQIIIQGIAI